MAAENARRFCPSGIIYDPMNVSEPEPHAPQELECDLVVLGGGGSGLVAAVRAAQESGCRVIVLEKAKKPGGNTTLGHGFLMRYTKWHEKAGLPDVREEYLNKLYEDTGRVMDYQLLRDATYGLSDMFDWLCTFGDVEKCFKLMKPGDPGVPPGIPFAMIDFPQRIENVNSSDTSMGPGWMGTFVVRKMLESAKSWGFRYTLSIRPSICCWTIRAISAAFRPPTPAALSRFMPRAAFCYRRLCPQRSAHDPY